jgi:hypothetical protein
MMFDVSISPNSKLQRVINEVTIYVQIIRATGLQTPSIRASERPEQASYRSIDILSYLSVYLSIYAYA